MRARKGISSNTDTRLGVNSSALNYFEISQKITDFAIKGLSLLDFITESLKIISTFIKSNKIKIEFEEENSIYKCLGQWIKSKAFNLEVKREPLKGNPFNLIKYSFVEDRTEGKSKTQILTLPLVLGKKKCGFLSLEFSKNYISPIDINSVKALIQSFVLALAYRRTHVALRERGKEQSCLYQLAKISSMPDISLPEIFQKTVELIPLAWLYPEITVARIIFDKMIYRSGNFNERNAKMSAEIRIADKNFGSVEVSYKEPKPKLDEGPFLKEERNLLNAIAGELSFVVQRKRTLEEKKRLEEQMLHADRLATIGQLSAGVAHELNEPLANILGFAQLASKSQELMEQTKNDLSKIVKASMHAREVIKKLLVFSRQTIPTKARVNLNDIVKEAIYFFESRCKKLGIELQVDTDLNMCSMYADGAQLNQILINLLVNAIQATPEGGKLIVRTYHDDGGVGLIVEDTGMGIKSEHLDKIFMPFFTTKDVNEGTGLGLAVVHGIVTSHGGKINVESNPGFGTSFNIYFPINILKRQKEVELYGI